MVENYKLTNYYSLLVQLMNDLFTLLATFYGYINLCRLYQGWANKRTGPHTAYVLCGP
jgi:hypothetical protein